MISSKILKRKIKKEFPKVKARAKKTYGKAVLFSRRRPFASFAVLLVSLLLLILLSNFLSRPREDPEQAKPLVKEVSVYSIGTSPKVMVQGKVEKSGVVKIVSLGSGVVQNVNVSPGGAVSKGQNLVSVSTNYSGGNAFSIQRQLAQVQYKNVLDTYNTSKELIDKQKELAEKNDKNTDELRNISSQSVTDSQNLINLNNEILSALSAQQAELETTNVGGANDAAILQTKQLRSQLESGNIQLESALRNTQYSSSGSNPLAEISDMSKDITLKQLDIQGKALDLNKEVSRLSLVLARINEAMMFPSAPISGVVERVYVEVGQAVTPGTPLLQISGDSQELKIVALVSMQMAKSISTGELSSISLGKKTYESAPFYVSTEATDGQLYSVHFSIPSEFLSNVTDNSYVSVLIPIGFAKTSSAIPFVPLDSVFQTQDETSVFLMQNGKAVSRKIEVSEVLGRFVEVESGLKEGDMVILNRNVITGDRVKISQ